MTESLPALESVKFLGVTIDQKLTFSAHIEDLCAKANRKINALFRIRSFLDVKKASILTNAYILSGFRYCSLIWMFCSKGDNAKITRVQVRSLRVTHLDFKTSSENLFQVYNSESVHTRNLKLPAVEVFKSTNRLNPSFMWDMFTPKLSSMTLPCGHRLRLPGKSESTTQGFIFRAVLLWNNLPKALKQVTSLNSFKAGLGQYSTPLYCKC